MNERLKRILTIIVFVLVVCVFGFFLYVVFFRTQPGETPIVTPPPTATGTLPGSNPAQPGQTTSGTTPGINPSTGLPEAGVIPQLPGQTLIPNQDRTNVLSSEVIKSISLEQNGNIRGYNPVDGKFYAISETGQSVALSDKVFYNVEAVTWGKQSDKAIIQYPDGTKTLYDFNAETQATLPKHWEDFDFAPQDSQIVAKAIGTNSSNRFLVTANPDGTNAKAIEELGDNADKVMASWAPNSQTVAFSFTAEPIGFDTTQIIMVGQNKENYKNLVVEGRGFIPVWSPTGQNLLYSVYNSASGFRPTLWVSGASGDTVNANRRNLGIQTWADKCAWRSEQELICAVPDSLEQGAGLNRELSSNVRDSIYRINLQDGTFVNLGRPTSAASIDQLLLSSDKNAVIYNDANSGQLIRFAL